MPWRPSRTQTIDPVAYTSPPAWDDGANCVGSMSEAARSLGNALMQQFPVISEVQGYACRQNTASPNSLSVHGTGRALDIMIPRLADGSADPRGDEVAQWLIDHASETGVQLIIWDRSIWSVARDPRGVLRDYSGPSSHTDHIHAELNADGAAGLLPWFRRRNSTPVWPGVVAGAVITASVGVGLYFGWRWFSSQRASGRSPIAAEKIDERLGWQTSRALE